MAAVLEDRESRDRPRINVKEDWRWWTKEWDVSVDQLKWAVAEVGPSVEAVAKNLGKTIRHRDQI